MNIVDSTQISLPATCRRLFAGSGASASCASAKIQVSYEYLSGTFNGLAVGRGRVSDQKGTFPVDWAQAGSLTLFDLGYFNQAALAAIASAQAFFVTRLNTQVALYWAADDPKAANLLGYLEAPPETLGEVSVWLGANTRLPVRLVYRRLPDKQVAEKRRQAHRIAQKKGRVCSAAHLRWLAWQVCVTNVPRSRWSPHQVLLVYRLRWQIELIFKLWKSQAKRTTLRAQRPDRMGCLRYAHWLGLLIFQALIAPYRALSEDTELSPVKAFHFFQATLPSLIRRIAAGWSTVCSPFVPLY